MKISILKYCGRANEHPQKTKSAQSAAAYVMVAHVCVSEFILSSFSMHNFIDMWLYLTTGSPKTLTLSVVKWHGLIWCSGKFDLSKS